MQLEHPPDLWGLLAAILISTISGIIAITRRIAQGIRTTIWWFTSELLAAILAGYLAYDVYQRIHEQLPDWCTSTLFIAISAHIGGRVFQGLETKAAEMVKHLPSNPFRKDP